MNLCGEFVTHKVFGRGKISEQENDCLTVQFGQTVGQKKFIYPSSLGTFLIPENNMIVQQMKADSDEAARQRSAAERESEDRKAQEKLAAKELAKRIKRAAAKAPSARTRKPAAK